MALLSFQPSASAIKHCLSDKEVSSFHGANTECSFLKVRTDTFDFDILTTRGKTKRMLEGEIGVSYLQGGISSDLMSVTVVCKWYLPLNLIMN